MISASVFRIAKIVLCHLVRPFGRFVQHKDDETDQSAPTEDEPKGCGDIGPIAYRALVDGQETCLDREFDQDSSLKASLEQSSSDSCHRGRDRRHHGNAGCIISLGVNDPARSGADSLCADESDSRANGGHDHSPEVVLPVMTADQSVTVDHDDVHCSSDQCSNGYQISHVRDFLDCGSWQI